MTFEVNTPLKKLPYLTELTKKVEEKKNPTLKLALDAMQSSNDSKTQNYLTSNDPSLKNRITQVRPTSSPALEEKTSDLMNLQRNQPLTTEQLSHIDKLKCGASDSDTSYKIETIIEGSIIREEKIGELKVLLSTKAEDARYIGARLEFAANAVSENTLRNCGENFKHDGTYSLHLKNIPPQDKINDILIRFPNMTGLDVSLDQSSRSQQFLSDMLEILPQFSKLRWLELRGSSTSNYWDIALTEKEFRQIALIKNLQNIFINHCQNITDRDIGILLDGLNLKSLRASNCDQITCTNFNSQRESYPHLTNLECPTLADESAANIARLFPNITSLTIGSLNKPTQHNTLHKITDKGLASISTLINVSHLSIHGKIHLSDEGAFSLSKLRRIYTLTITCPETAQAFSYLGRLRELRYLELKNCEHLTDEGLLSLQNLTGLRCLILGSTNCTYSGMTQLVSQLPHFQKGAARTGAVLFFGVNDHTRRGYNRLREALPEHIWTQLGNHHHKELIPPEDSVTQSFSTADLANVADYMWTKRTELNNFSKQGLMNNFWEQRPRERENLVSKLRNEKNIF